MMRDHGFEKDVFLDASMSGGDRDGTVSEVVFPELCITAKN